MKTSTLYVGSAVRVEQDPNGIAILCFDRQGETINKFDTLTVTELALASATIAARGDVRGLLITSAKSTFIVGADIFEFTTRFAQPEEAIAAQIADQNEVFSRLEDLPFPSVAAIKGLALGGGFELALACDERVMATGAQLGLPEVSLGLFPGFGGTVRLPRLIGVGAAIEWISGGEPRDAAAALAAGAVGQIASPDDLLAAALTHLERLIDSADWLVRRKNRQGPFEIDAEALARAKEALAPTAAQRPAALAAVELMERCAALPRDAALHLEHRAFARIARTRAATSMIQIFINEQHLRKTARAYFGSSRLVRRTAVLGAGITGAGIAFTSARRAIPVILTELISDRLESAVAEIDRLSDSQVKSGRMTPAQALEVGAAIQTRSRVDRSDAVDLVIEALGEDSNVKRRALAEVEASVAHDTIIASNTSSLSITELGAALHRPANFVGMHFFNPVTEIPLVEIIRAPATGETAVATAVTYATRLGKTAVVVRECPGFLVNRILAPYMLAFLQLVDEGVDFQRIDRVMEAQAWPMGPAHLQDVLGIDTLARLLEVISHGYSARMRLDSADVLQRLRAAGRLGHECGTGWYRYVPDAQGSQQRQADPDIVGAVGLSKSAASCATSDAQIVDRLMIPMVLEATRCLEEGIVESPAEVDQALVLGLGFPRHWGGPLEYADWFGAAEIVRRCELLSGSGPMYSPSESLRVAAASGCGFYGGGKA